MAKKVSRVEVQIGADTKGLKKGIAESKKEVKGFGSSLKGMAIAAAAAFSVRAIVNFGKAAVKAADTQIKAETGLLVALKGRADVQQRLIGQAGELQKKTLFGDEETIKAQSLIAAFVKEEAAIKKVLPLVQDLATAKGMDLAAAADMVSKTLGSSTNALARYGIEVNGAVGSTDRLDSLTRNLTSAFGGQAEAAALVGSGPMVQLNNASGDLSETLGNLLLPAIQGISKALTTVVTKTDEWLKSIVKL